MNITWSQEENKVFLHIDDYKFYMIAPENFDIHTTRSELKELCLHYLFYGLNINQKLNKNSKKEYPNMFINKTYTFREKCPNIGLAYSNGVNSGACLELLPKDVTVPIFLYRNYQYTDKDILTKFNIPDLIESYNKLALNGITKINELTNYPKVNIIQNDFELIRIVLTNGEKLIGWNCPFGHISLLILLADHFNLGYLSMGSVLEGKFLKNGCEFKNVIINSSESDYMTAMKILKCINVELFYPVAGLSEVLTTKIIHNSPLKDICSSCVVGEDKHCLNCHKCFIKTAINGELLKVSRNIKKLMDKYPIKQATATVYSCQKIEYNESNIINKYMKLDLTFLERYYINYLYPAHNEVDFVQTNFKECIRLNLEKNNIFPMDYNDVNNLVNIGKHFNDLELYTTPL